jgi:amidase/6-aminohexanoate-cyclic-dimer hydrolase
MGRGVGWNGLSTQHAVTISVRDSAALLDALAGPEPGDSIVPPPAPGGSFLAAASRAPKALRIALIEDAPTGATLHDDCRAAVRDAARLLEALGHQVEPARLDLDGERLARGLQASVAVDVAGRLDRRAAQLGRAIREDEVEPVTWSMARRGRTVSAQTYIEARAAFDEAAATVGAAFQTYDLILQPTLAEPPGPLGRLGLSPESFADYGKALAAFSPYTALHNEIGAPAMSVPLYWNGDGLPIGVMVVAPYGAEDLLFSLAGQLEGARPWADRRPPICAA